MCGIQSAESASLGGTIRVLERALAEAKATIAALSEEVARLRVLQVFKMPVEGDCDSDTVDTSQEAQPVKD